MPTRKGGNLHVTHLPQKKILHDSWLHGGYYLDGSVDKDSLSFTINYTPHRFYIPTGKRKSLTLICDETNNKGFVVYSIDSDELNNDSFCHSLRGKMNPSIYHYIKECFHHHEYHRRSDDALLSPFVKEGDFSLESDERDMLLFYLEQYKSKFEDFLTYGLEEFDCAKRKVNMRFRLSNGIKTIGDIISNGNQMKGERQYCEYLLKSAREKAWISKELRKALNESCDIIDDFLREVNDAYNVCTSGLGVKYGRWGIGFGVFGVFVSALGIAYSVLHKPDYQEIHNHVDSVVVSSQIEIRNNIRGDIEKSSESLKDSIRQSNKELMKRLNKK